MASNAENVSFWWRYHGFIKRRETPIQMSLRNNNIKKDYYTAACYAVHIDNTYIQIRLHMPVNKSS